MKKNKFNEIKHQMLIFLDEKRIHNTGYSHLLLKNLGMY